MILFDMEHFKGTKVMTRGHGGNRLHCLPEVSGLVTFPDIETKLGLQFYEVKTKTWEGEVSGDLFGKTNVGSFL